jgi:co-chaperonin GroES (HSP10)
MNANDKLVQSMLGRTYWVLLQTEDSGTTTDAGLLLAKAIKTPFSKVLSVGPKVDPEICKVGDRVMFREGLAINTKEDKFTDRNYVWVHCTNILGVIPPQVTEVPVSANGNGAGPAGPKGPEATT